jgi:hypothetical protein
MHGLPRQMDGSIVMRASSGLIRKSHAKAVHARTGLAFPSEGATQWTLSPIIVVTVATRLASELRKLFSYNKLRRFLSHHGLKFDRQWLSKIVKVRGELARHCSVFCA